MYKRKNDKANMENVNIWGEMRLSVLFLHFCISPKLLKLKIIENI